MMSTLRGGKGGAAMTRHHANNILLTRNVHFDSEVRQ